MSGSVYFTKEPGDRKRCARVCVDGWPGGWSTKRTEAKERRRKGGKGRKRRVKRTRERKDRKQERPNC